jgi:hypothetical protein
MITSGRYGMGSKDFTPAMQLAFLKKEERSPDESLLSRY